MHPDPLTPEEIQRLSQQIDGELLELSQAPRTITRSPVPGPQPPGWPEKQRRAIEQATGEPAASFWTRFKRAARKDLCEEGGQLYHQWQRWGDIQNDRLILFTYGALLGMGFHGAIVYVLIVAVAVSILAIGLKAFCDQG